jgi:nicotinamidase-related amidase
MRFDDSKATIKIVHTVFAKAKIMITIEDSGLLIVDVQGKLAEKMHESPAMFKNLSILIQGARLFDIPIVWVEQLPNKLGPTHKNIAQYLTGQVISKSTFSAWGNDDVRYQIEKFNRRNWLIAGIECHVCVYQTVRDLLKMHYDVHVVSDAVSSRTLENKNLGLQAMQVAGAKLTSTEMVLFELQKKAEGEVFKQLIKLVK